MKMTLPLMRLTSFIGPSMRVYHYVQELKHGEMPLPTLEGVIELLDTANPEARNIAVVVHPDDPWDRIWDDLIMYQQEIVKQAMDNGMQFELHVFAHLPKRRKQ